MIDYKQKAKEIVEKYWNIEWDAHQERTISYKPMPKKVAKECAKIHVKGIIEALPSSSKTTFRGASKVSIYDCWQQILTEIENL